MLTGDKGEATFSCVLIGEEGEATFSHMLIGEQGGGESRERGDERGEEVLSEGSSGHSVSEIFCGEQV